MCNSQVEKRSHEFEIKEDPVFLRQKAAPAASNREVWHRATAIVCASVSSFEEDEKKVILSAKNSNVVHENGIYVCLMQCVT